MQFSTVRPEPADIERLTELYRECRRATDMAIVPEYFESLPDFVFSEKWKNLFSGNTHKGKLALANGAWAGFYIVGPMDDYNENLHDRAVSKDCGELHQIYLLPAYQGKGFGKKLYKELQQDFRELGYSSFIACTYLENEGAKAFYKAIGATHLKDDVLGAPWHRPVTFYIDKA